MIRSLPRIVPVVVLAWSIPAAAAPTTVEGRVKDGRGRPLANVRVEWKDGRALTDGDGRYEVTSDDQEIEIKYRLAGYTRYPHDEKQKIEANQALKTIYLYDWNQETPHYHAEVAAELLRRVKKDQEKLENVWAEFEASGPPPSARLFTARLALNAFGENDVPKALLDAIESTRHAAAA